jgi:hypothetical protein
VITLAVIANAILGGLWRRVLGGWFAQRRSYVMAVGVLLTWPLWVVLPWEWAAALAAAVMMFWAEGHQFDKWTIILRYPLIGVIYPIGKRFWPAHYTSVGEIVIGAFLWGLLSLILLFK